MQTPYELWHEVKPDLAHLEVFGTSAFSIIFPKRRDRLDPRAVKIIFFGYSDSHKGYRLMDPKKHKLVVSRDVRFVRVMPVDEDEVVVEYQFGEFQNTVPRDREPASDVDE